jgi:hypothetical protein
MVFFFENGKNENEPAPARVSVSDFLLGQFSLLFLFFSSPRCGEISRHIKEQNYVHDNNNNNNNGRRRRRRPRAQQQHQQSFLFSTTKRLDDVLLFFFFFIFFFFG